MNSEMNFSGKYEAEVLKTIIIIIWQYPSIKWNHNNFKFIVAKNIEGWLKVLHFIYGS
jgi:hypothetical protein